MYEYKRNEEEKVICPGYERENPYGAASENLAKDNIDDKIDKLIKVILDIDITVMNNGEEFNNSLDTYLDNFEINRLKDKIRYVLTK